MFLIKRESQLNHYVLILFLKLVGVLDLKIIPNYWLNSQIWGQHFPLLLCDHWDGNWSISNKTMGEEAPFLFLKGESEVVVVEEVAARELEPRCLKGKVKVAQPCLTLSWNSPGWNTGVGSPSLLQGIFPTRGLNPGLLHHRWILYQLRHKGSPRCLKERQKLGTLSLPI